MKVLYVIAGSGEGHDQIFSRRQAAALRESGVDVTTILIGTWNGLRAWLPRFRHLRATIQEQTPDLVHAQCGTMTGLTTLLEVGGVTR